MEIRYVPGWGGANIWNSPKVVTKRITAKARSNNFNQLLSILSLPVLSPLTFQTSFGKATGATVELLKNWSLVRTIQIYSILGTRSGLTEEYVENLSYQDILSSMTKHVKTNDNLYSLYKFLLTIKLSQILILFLTYPIYKLIK